MGDYAASNATTVPLDALFSGDVALCKQVLFIVKSCELTEDENNSDPWQHLHQMVSRGAEAGLAPNGRPERNVCL